MTPGPASSRAVIFDMDDTLYPERRFALSGFAAVAQTLGTRTGIEACELFRLLAGALRRGQRRTALQLLCRRYELPPTTVEELVAVIRAHTPRLRLPSSTSRVLAALRPSWRLGVLTNGSAAIQARKVDALGVAPMVDAVVFATEHGTGLGKPDPAAFLAATWRLDVDATRCVFVGDDPECDIEGANRVGMRSVQVQASGRGGDVGSSAQQPDSLIESLSELPHVAAALLEERCEYVNHDRASSDRT